MSDFKRNMEHKKRKFADGIKEATGKATGNEPMKMKNQVQSSQADLMKSMYVEDDIDDIRDVIARKINDKIDRNEKQIDLAYWANVHNTVSSQIILHAQESLPEIHTTKKIYMIIVMGRVVMQLGDQEERMYSPGNSIDVSSRTKMRIKNISPDRTAIIVMKS